MHPGFQQLCLAGCEALGKIFPQSGKNDLPTCPPVKGWPLYIYDNSLNLFKIL